MIATARELPDLRRYVAEFMGGSNGPALICAASDPREATSADAITSDHVAWAADAVRSLERAELFHIQPVMVELLLQASGGIGEAGFMDHDLPAKHGLAYLAGPAPATHDGRDWHEVLAVSWSYVPPSANAPAYPHGYVALSWYLERDSWSEVMDLWQDGDKDNDETRVAVARLVPPLVWDGHITIACHPDAAGVTMIRHDFHANIPGSWRERRGDMFRALCYLLRQRVAESEIVVPDRAARRRAQREGQKPTSVRVITLRGIGTGGGTGEGSREWRHRWMVRGHWRRQWYSSIKGHRPVWITPYVKGPGDAPLLGGEKVYSVRP